MAVAGTLAEIADPPNANWQKCDGDHIANWTYPDYWRRVGFTYGPRGIGLMRLPNRPGWCICVTDDPSYPPPAPPVNVDVPAVSQAAPAPSDLACTMGNWQGEPTSYSYQWQIDGADVGTDAPTLAVTALDVGKSAVCTVTAVNAAGSTAAPPSSPLVIV